MGITPTYGKDVIRINGIITYGSYYGATKRYAQALAERLDWQACPFDSMDTLEPFDTVIHMGGLYAGNVTGLKAVTKKLPPNAVLFVVTVGLADGSLPKQHANICSMVRRQVPPEFYDEQRIVTLRGSMDYDKLSGKHKAMMSVLYQVLRMRGKKRTPEEDQMLETRRHPVDYTDLDALSAVETAVQALAQKK